MSAEYSNNEEWKSWMQSIQNDTYVERICLSCGSTAEDWQNVTRCSQCGGYVVLVHAANTEEGRQQVQQQIERLKSDPLYREAEDRRFQPGK